MQCFISFKTKGIGIERSGQFPGGGVHFTHVAVCVGNLPVFHLGVGNNFGEIHQRRIVQVVMAEKNGQIQQGLRIVIVAQRLEITKGGGVNTFCVGIVYGFYLGFYHKFFCFDPKHAVGFLQAALKPLLLGKQSFPFLGHFLGVHDGVYFPKFTRVKEFLSEAESLGLEGDALKGLG